MFTFRCQVCNEEQAVARCCLLATVDSSCMPVSVQQAFHGVGCPPKGPVFRTSSRAGSRSLLNSSQRDSSSDLNFWIQYLTVHSLRELSLKSWRIQHLDPPADKISLKWKTPNELLRYRRVFSPLLELWLIGARNASALIKSNAPILSVTSFRAFDALICT